MDNFLIPIDRGGLKNALFIPILKDFPFYFMITLRTCMVAVGLVNPVVKRGTRVDCLFAKNKDV